MSPIDYTGGTLKAFGPKVGESKIIHIRSVAKVEDPTLSSADNFTSRTKNFGYRFELTLTNGRIFMLNVWKLFFAFKEVDVQDGDKINIDHPAEGVYKITILEKGTGVGLEVEDTEKIAYDAEQEKNGGAEGNAISPSAQAPAVAPATVAAPEVKPAAEQKPAETTAKTTVKTEEKEPPVDIPF